MNLESLEELTSPMPISGHVPAPPKSRSKTLLIGYLYFIQGIMLSLPNSIVLTYSKLPSYDVLSWFAACTLPFGLKFISGTWIII